MKSTSRGAEFRAYSQQITDVIWEEGIAFRPYAHPSLPYFHRLPALEQEDVLNKLKLFVQICLAVKNAGASLKDNRAMVAKALLAFDLTAKEDDLKLIQPYHLVEFYNRSDLQIFRSFRYFELFSYTIEDIYCRKWLQLYDRNQEDQTAMTAAVLEFVNLPNKTAVNVHLPEHKIKERESLERLITYNQTQWLIPLYHKGDFAAVMALHRTRSSEERPAF